MDNYQEKQLCSDVSTFTGGAFANFFMGLLTVITSILTLGIAYPFMMCWRLRWVSRHTYINGQQLSFDGTGLQLWGKFLLWILFSIITLGIYAIFVMPLNIERWQTSHTHFDSVKKESNFDGSIWGLFGIKILTFLVNIVTLSLGQFWAHCYKERWFCKHRIYDGCRLKFDGTGLQYFGKRIVWLLLTIVTLGIYSFWLVVKTKKWTISHTFVENTNELKHLYQEETEDEKTEKVEEKIKNYTRGEKQVTFDTDNFNTTTNFYKFLTRTQSDENIDISENAYCNVSDLVAIKLGTNLRKIGNYAFYGCTSLYSIIIPISCTSIGEKAFGECKDLKEILYKGTLTQWNAIEKEKDWDLNTGHYIISCADGYINK